MGEPTLGEWWRALVASAEQTVEFRQERTRLEHEELVMAEKKIAELEGERDRLQDIEHAAREAVRTQDTDEFFKLKFALEAYDKALNPAECHSANTKDGD